MSNLCALARSDVCHFSSRRLTEETLSTTMSLVEQVLYARPITSASSDPDHFEALMPNQFQLGRASVSLPVGVVKPDDFNHRRAFANPSRL